MDTRSSVPRIVAAFFLVMTFPSIGSSDTVHIYTGDFNLPIPAGPGDTNGWMTDAVIEIPDHLIISDLNVRLTLTHEALFDLQILLQSPAGTTVLLNPAGNSAFIVRGEDGHLYAYGGSVEWFFDDQAETSIEQAAEPFIGAFRPVEDLSSFNEQDSFGSWRLQIYDAFPPDTGTFNHFELIFTAPEPAAAILLTLGLALMRLRSPRRN
jgi:hypothetical protein